MNLKGLVGVSLLSVFVLMRLFASLPLILFAILPFSLFVGATLTVWFLYDTVSKWSEFNQTIVLALVFIPISVFIILPIIVNGTPTGLRSGLGPFNISLRFLFWIGLSQFISLIPASLIILFYPDSHKTLQKTKLVLVEAHDESHSCLKLESQGFSVEEIDVRHLLGRG